MYSSIRPGKFWYDTDGKRIQAHGGSIIFIDNVFYWYGENKDGITGTSTGEKCPFWHHGVKLYSSTDLYNWKDEGFVIKESDDINNPFHPTHIMDRPHILYNKKNDNYVLWAKTTSTDFGQCEFSICVGKFIKDMKYIKRIVLPMPYHAGDFDLVEDDGKAYVIFENPHFDMICIELSDNYQDITDNITSHIKEECPPLVREAPAYFKRNGIKYLLTSGTTGYYPNRSKIHKINSFEGNWEDLGFCCINDKNNNSFHAQFSSVFKHPYKEDLYIALGDRWLLDIAEDAPNMDEAFYEMFSKNVKEKRNLYSHNLSDENTSEATYVWLPIKFDNENNPYIEYIREWKIENYKGVKKFKSNS